MTSSAPNSPPLYSPSPITHHPSPRTRRVASRGILYITATFFAVFAALPFAWMIITVFKQNNDLYNPNNNPFLYNDPPTLEHIQYLFDHTQYATFVRNSFVVAMLVVIITLIGAVPAAYSLSRLAGRWGEGLTAEKMKE